MSTRASWLRRRALALASMSAALVDEGRLIDEAQSIADLRRLAHRATPRSVFDWVDGLAEEGLSQTRAQQAYRDVELRPSMLADVAAVDTSVSIAGGTSSVPFGIAPTGMTRMLHAAGESAGAEAAGAAGIPFALSSLATTSVAEVVAATSGGRCWFQVFPWSDHRLTDQALAMAESAGVDTLIVTVDVPTSGARLRDRYNRFTVPPPTSARDVARAFPRTRWWSESIDAEPLSFPAFAGIHDTVPEVLGSVFDPSATTADVSRVRERWAGALAIKGIQTVDDAMRGVDLGADAIVLSNHGGRQLDRGPVPLRLLPAVRGAVGDQIELWIDGGITSGVDIVAALALGADFTLVGKAYLYGLMAGGRAGVARAIEILSEDVVRTMRLLGVTTIDQLDPDHVRWRADPS